MKRIDRLLIVSFFPPFVVTFFIALFVLVMQTLWLYIDEIAGKGVGFFLMAELLGYLSVSMFPLALPIAVLISSVMVLGNMAEHYELSSFKSAGVSLWRVMAPLMAITVLIASFSYFSSNNLIPVSNLKFRSRLYDIRKQKPALNLEAGVFNDDFKGYSIHIGKKSADNKRIKKVLIIDHSQAQEGTLVEIAAEEGDMYLTEDERFFVMNLRDGWQYQDLTGQGEDQRKYPFLRTHFEEWSKVFDLREFELSRTDEDLFKSHQSMLTVAQLAEAIDSIDLTIEQKIASLRRTNHRYFSFYANEVEEILQREKDSLVLLEPEPDTSANETLRRQRPTLLNVPDSLRQRADSLSVAKTNVVAQNLLKKRNVPLVQLHLNHLDTMSRLDQTFPSYKLPELYGKAKTTVRGIRSQTEAGLKGITRRREARVNYIFELNSKFSLAMACIMFLFIGAPMGAIVRKGGFGYPMLISIGFFMLFMIINIFSKNIAERFVIHPALAAWIPCLVLFPIGFLLTYQAMNDYRQVVSMDSLRRFFRYGRSK